MKKIFFTGVSGFIGSHLIKQIKGYDVTCLLISSEVEKIKDIPQKFNVEFGDLTNFENIENIILKIKPDIIMHLAALTPVRHSFEHPEIYQSVTYSATANMINAALKLPSFEKFIFASTMETYGIQPCRAPFKENAQLNPASPYAVAKSAAEQYLKMAGYAHNFPYMIAKACNTFGRKNETGYVVEYLITTMLRNEVPYIGTPDAVRDLMYVDDHVNAYLSLLDYPLEAKNERLKLIEEDPSHYVFNFGNGSELTIKDIAQKIAKLTGYKGKIQHGFPENYPYRPKAEKYLSLDASKAKKILKWKPKVFLEDGLQKTINYWKNRI